MTYEATNNKAIQDLSEIEIGKIFKTESHPYKKIHKFKNCIQKYDWYIL